MRKWWQRDSEGVKWGKWQQLYHSKTFKCSRSIHLLFGEAAEHLCRTGEANL